MLWLDGEEVGEETPLFPAAERGVLLGDGIFETIRVEKNKPLLLKRHLLRLQSAAQQMGFDVNTRAVETMARHAATACETASLRITVLRGTGPRGLLPPREPQHRILMSLSSAGQRAPACRSVVLATVRRNEGSPLSRMKCVSYADQVIARMEAQAAGAEDAIMLNNRGEPASTSCANLMVKVDEGWVTPPVKTGLLPGIVREVLIEKGLVTEAPIDLNSLRIRPLLRTNSLIGIEPLQLGDGPVAEERDLAALTAALRTAENDEA